MVDGADARGLHDERLLRGDERVVAERQASAANGGRARLAVQAALDRLQPAPAQPVVTAETLQREREAVAARGGIADKTAGKVATDEHTWSLFVEEPSPPRRQRRAMPRVGLEV
eukprot:4521782-Prymnesium_polylepis.1